MSKKSMSYAGLGLLVLGLILLLMTPVSTAGGGTTSTSTSTTPYYSVTTATTTATQTTSTSGSGTTLVDIHVQLCQSGTCTPYSTTVYVLPAGSLCGSTQNPVVSSGTGTNGYLAVQVSANTAYSIQAAGQGFLSTQCQSITTGAAGTTSSVTLTFTSTGFSIIPYSSIATSGSALIGIIFMGAGVFVIYRSSRRK